MEVAAESPGVGENLQDHPSLACVWDLPGGGSLADAEKQYLGRRDPTLKTLDDWNRHRGGTTVNPINEVAKVNIALLMVHGDVDRRVMYYHLKDYQKAFEAAGKNGEFITMKGADHLPSSSS